MHRRERLLALLRTERREQRLCKLVGSLIEGSEFAAPRGGESRNPSPPVIAARRHLYEAAGLQGAQQPALIARVEAETRASDAPCEAVQADLPQQPSLAEWPLAPEKVLVECPD